MCLLRCVDVSVGGAWMSLLEAMDVSVEVRGCVCWRCMDVSVGGAWMCLLEAMDVSVEVRG